MDNIVLHLSKGDVVFAVGEVLLRDGEKTNISVIKIRDFFGTIKVYLSNNEILVYKNVTFSFIKNGRQDNRNNIA
jgi:hypothetical protein